MMVFYGAHKQVKHCATGRSLQLGCCWFFASERELWCSNTYDNIVYAFTIIIHDLLELLTWFVIFLLSEVPLQNNSTMCHYLTGFTVTPYRVQAPTDRSNTFLSSSLIFLSSSCSLLFVVRISDLFIYFASAFLHLFCTMFSMDTRAVRSSAPFWGDWYRFRLRPATLICCV